VSEPAGLPQVQDDVVRIADLAEAAAVGDYDALLVRADFTDDGVVEMEGDLLRAAQTLPLNVDSAALDHFERMRAAFQAAGQPLWTKAEVRVDDTGAATVHFDYPDTAGP
jgi:hypothetical protein